jgi:hypothetical protein
MCRSTVTLSVAPDPHRRRARNSIAPVALGTSIVRAWRAPANAFAGTDTTSVVVAAAGAEATASMQVRAAPVKTRSA